MLLFGEIQEIIISPSGLESVVKVLFNEPVGALWCYILLAGCYEPCERPEIIKADIDESDEPAILKVGDGRDFNISVIFVSKYDVLSDNEILGFQQPIHESPHTIIKGIVKEIIDNNTMICEIGFLCNDILVNLESDINNITTGDKIQFKGEIKAEPIQSEE